MANLPRHTAQVPTGLGSAGTVRATDLRILTDTGEQEKFAAKGAKAAAIGDIARSAQGVAEMIYRADQKRHGLETDQQLKDFQTEYDKQVVGLWMEREDLQVKSREVRDAFRDDAVTVEDKLYEKTLKEYEKNGWLNKDVLNALKNNRERQKLLFYIDAHDLGTGKLDEYQQVNGKSMIGAMVAAGDEAGAREQMAYYMSQNLFSEIDGKNILDEFITKKAGMDILKSKNDFDAAEAYVRGLDNVTTDVKRRVIGDLRVESEKTEIAQEKLANQMLVDVWNGDITDPQIITDALEQGAISDVRAKSLRKMIVEPKEYTSLEALEAEVKVREAIDKFHAGDISDPSSLKKLKQDAINALYDNAGPLGKAKGSSMLTKITEEKSDKELANNKADAEMKREGKALMEEYIRTKDPFSGMFTDDKQEIMLTAEAQLLLDIEIDKAIDEGKPLGRRDMMIKMMEIGKQQRRKLDDMEKKDVPSVPYELGTGKSKYTKTATNPKTGERLGWDGTKWVPIQ